MMNTFAEITASGGELNATQILLGLASFLTVALGGLAIGVVMGVLTALITRTTSEVRGASVFPISPASRDFSRSGDSEKHSHAPFSFYFLLQSLSLWLFSAWGIWPT